ncbi:MAG: DinB family protein [Meiothermus sp.]|nr:DinB family protein [Meiothermus sp.]
MTNPAPVPAFLRGNLEQTSTLASAWIRGLESTEEQIMKWTTGLSPEGLWWSATPDSNTIGGLINHIWITNLRLLHFAQGVALPAELNKTAPEQLAPTGEGLEDILRKFVAAQTRLKAALRQMSPEDLETPRERLGQWVPALHLCHKLVEHSHEHVGQIITLRKLWNAQKA